MAEAKSEEKRWRDLRKRFLSALVLGPTALLCVWLGAELYTLLIAICIAILTWEWVHLCGMRTRVFPGLGVPLAIFLAGIVAAIWICGRRLRDRGYDSEDALNVAWWAVPFGIVGGVPGKIIGQRNPDALHFSGKFKLPFF